MSKKVRDCPLRAAVIRHCAEPKTLKELATLTGAAKEALSHVVSNAVRAGELANIQPRPARFGLYALSVKPPQVKRGLRQALVAHWAEPKTSAQLVELTGERASAVKRSISNALARGEIENLSPVGTKLALYRTVGPSGKTTADTRASAVVSIANAWWGKQA